ncbi:SDR family NAD(P)-dependent oxidoreductase [Sphingobium sp. JS3065]|uniref:SDR family NAD(P)-dependent oxidoreductase n=1 Tax=Sphingobium sp. JS3065 TaxID=2970925 RepID=UPI002264CD57|nr:SDR family NAD(P)-dependent oxidoreductase [Sphingobium sp. JS3065]UZW57248.1 SDR family NAD(P)-dependent oxidoreductase [Sphingobium sp. JS3065]
MTELRFDGRVAVVTGAARGLGRAYAELLASRGAKVIVNDPGGNLAGEGGDTRPAQEAADAIVAAGGEAIANFDAVGTVNAAQSIISQAIDAFGRIDIIVNNAGNFLPLHPFEEATHASFNRFFSVHVLGAIDLIQAAWPHFKRQNYGRIVNTGSSVGYYGSAGRIEYGVAKGAVHGLTRCLAHEAGDADIRVNLIAPGALTRPGEERLGNDVSEELRRSFGPALVAPIVAWLCHENCPVSGASFTSIAGTTTMIGVGETPGFASDAPTLEDIRDNFDRICGAGMLEASSLDFWDNGETQGRELLSRYGRR